jgi:hypothetical protein
VDDSTVATICDAGEQVSSRPGCLRSASQEESENAGLQEFLMFHLEAMTIVAVNPYNSGCCYPQAALGCNAYHYMLCKTAMLKQPIADCLHTDGKGRESTRNDRTLP